MSFSLVGLGCAPAGNGGTLAAADKPAELLPVPAAPELEKAAALVSDIFKAEIDKAKTPLQKRELARKLLNAAADTKDDPVGRFALLQRAADLAAAGGDLPTAAEAIDQQARSHAVDAPQMKFQAAEAASKAVRFPTQHESFGNDLLPVLDASIAADRYEIAQRLAELLVHSAKVARNQKLASSASNLHAEVEQLVTEYKTLAEPLARHKSGAASPADKLILGKFYCFLKGDWNVGLPLLAESGDELLGRYAADELAVPTEPADQLKLADCWWSCAEEAKGLRAQRIRQHAAIWYQRALPQLAGLSAAKAKRNIETAAGEQPKLSPKVEHPPPPLPVAQVDLLALSQESQLSRLVAGGEWSRSKDGVVSGDSAYVRLAIPYRVKGPYELEVEFKVLSGKDENVCLILPVGDRQTVLCIDGWVSRGRLTYLCNVNGREAVNNPSAIRGKHLKRGQLHNAHLDVSWDDRDGTAQVIFTLDGDHVFTWNGRTSELSVQSGWELPRSREIGLASYVTNTEFCKATLIEK
ncbi:MAG: hypothetical protein L0211_07315 [Planctomycetaceae bacterium]|nr:hypothetical protein [Planctomycetaceae bacterium]